MSEDGSGDGRGDSHLLEQTEVQGEAARVPGRREAVGAVNGENLTASVVSQHNDEGPEASEAHARAAVRF